MAEEQKVTGIPDLPLIKPAYVITPEKLLERAAKQGKRLAILGLERRGCRKTYRDGSVTDCCSLSRDNKVVALGFSCCSPEDKYNWLRGRLSATSRALMALLEKENVRKLSEMMWRNNLAYWDILVDFGFLGVYKPAKPSKGVENWNE